jgi:hypothetical protein
MIVRIAFVFLAVCLSTAAALAQNATQARVVGTCGTPGITYTAGAFGPITVDTSGNLCYNGSGGGATSSNITEWAGVTLGSPSNYGTSPGAVAVPGVNAFVTNPVSTTPSNSGTINNATSALGSNEQVCSGPCALYSFNVSADSTLSAAAWWIMIFNTTSLPSPGTVTPVRCIALPSGTTSYTGAFPVGLPLTPGGNIAVSTTGCFTLTASIHAFIAGDVK